MLIDAFSGRPARRRGLAALAALAMVAFAGAAMAQGVQRPGPPGAGGKPPPPINNRGDVGVTPGPVNTDLLTAEDPNRLVQELQALAYKDVAIGIDSEGDPKITGKIGKNDTPYQILFYGCRDHKQCQFLQFVVGYDMTNGLNQNKVAEWNRTKLWGQVYRDDEDDPFISVVYNLHGGVSKENFADTVDWFKITVEGFEDFIGWNS